MLLKSILQAMDEWHSLTSKQKGLAGMAENVRQGWRAGGRAPIGYRLEYTETGAIREGMPVRKSKLSISDDAPTVKHYPALGAQGTTRPRACSESGMQASSSTLVNVEWNALTYAGHTAWNVRYEHGAGGFANGVKRRPRAEWIIQRNTHEALITDIEAEALLVRLESFDRAHHSHADYLLTGLLKAPDGTNWRGSDGGAGGYYRMGKGKRNKASIVEAAVLEQLAEDLHTPDFVQARTDAARKQFDDRKHDDALPGMKKEYADLERRIKRLTEMLADTATPEPLLRQIENYESRRNEIEVQIGRCEEEAKQMAKVKALAAPQVSKTLTMIAEEFEEWIGKDCETC
jgi:site-specific DNA recombinase